MASISTLDPTRRNHAVQLSSDKRTAYGTSGIASYAVLGTVLHSTGKKYFEVHAISTTNATFIGLFNSTGATNAQYYAALNSASGAPCYTLQQDGRVWPTGSSTGSGFWVGNKVGVAVDISGGKIWFAVNNVWQNGGNPSAGTNPNLTGYTFTGLVPLTSKGSNSSNGHLLCSNDDQCYYSAPSGFSYWEETVSIGNNATTIAGDAVDSVYLFEFVSGDLISKIVPETNGSWSFSMPIGVQYIVAYMSSGHYPIIHGPYTAS